MMNLCKIRKFPWVFWRWPIRCFAWWDCFANAWDSRTTSLASNRPMCTMMAYTLFDEWCMWRTVHSRRSFCIWRWPNGRETEESSTKSWILECHRRASAASTDHWLMLGPLRNYQWPFLRSIHGTIGDCHDECYCPHKYFLNNSPRHRTLHVARGGRVCVTWKSWWSLTKEKERNKRRKT